MQDSPFKKLLLIMLLLATSAALLLQLITSQFAPKAELSASKVEKSEPQYSYQPPRPKISAQAQSPAEEETNILDQLKIPRDKAEAWLAKHHRNAASLLAVFRAQGDTNYLNEAATNFPNDPQVALTILAHDAFPQDRRKWLDLFKASSPSNSLANYFSAEDYFQNGKPEEAMQELLAASGKAQFDNHGMETQLDAEEMYLDSGKSPMEAATFALSAMAGDNLPELADLKRLDNGIADLMKQKIAAGDPDSALSLAQMGMNLANQLNSGDGGKYAINHLVGISTEAIILNALDQNTAYDFLDSRTPGQVLRQLKQEKSDYRQQMANFQAAYPDLSAAELNNYYRRAQIYGEIEAQKWVIQQHPPAVPQQ
jgi:hypothetical protein